MTSSTAIVETLCAKRDGKEIDAAAIDRFVAGLVDGQVADYQAAAFAMAVCINGMSVAETAALTTAMSCSGDTIEWDEEQLGGPVLDKHSSGGVGDKVSILLAPIVAACGGFVPMVSGRGLGHTGGTLDKLASIPGLCVDLPPERFRQTVKETGCAIVSAGKDLAPADRRLYSIRDVTATVDSIPLITASILSKKLAAGCRKMVMDIKIGSGAFMKRLEDGQALAHTMMAVAKPAEMELAAFLTDMDEPLGHAVGNAVEIAEVADILCLKENGNERMRLLTVELAGQMLVMGRLADDLEEGKAMADESLATGAAAEAFASMVVQMGGAADFLDRYDSLLPSAEIKLEVRPEAGGHVEQVDAQQLAIAVLEMGGGRQKVDNEIDCAVGLSGLAKRGDFVDASPEGRPLAIVHARSDQQAQQCVDTVRASFGLTAEKQAAKELILERHA